MRGVAPTFTTRLVVLAIAAGSGAAAPPTDDAPVLFDTLRRAKEVKDDKGRTVYATPEAWSPYGAILGALVPRADVLSEGVFFVRVHPFPFADTRWQQLWAAVGSGPAYSKPRKMTIEALCRTVVQHGFVRTVKLCKSEVIDADRKGAVAFVNRARRLELSVDFNDSRGTRKGPLLVEGASLVHHHASKPPSRTSRRVTGRLTPLERETLDEIDLEKLDRIYVTRGQLMHRYPGERSIDALKGRRQCIVVFNGRGHDLFATVTKRLAGDTLFPSAGLAPTGDRPGLHTGTFNAMSELRFVYAAVE